METETIRHSKGCGCLWIKKLFARRNTIFGIAFTSTKIHDKIHLFKTNWRKTQKNETEQSEVVCTKSEEH